MTMRNMNIKDSSAAVYQNSFMATSGHDVNALRQPRLTHQTLSRALETQQIARKIPQPKPVLKENTSALSEPKIVWARITILQEKLGTSWFKLEFFIPLVRANFNAPSF